MIKPPAGSVLIGKVNIAGRDIVIGLLVVGFNPRSVCLVAQSEIHVQAFCDTPCILAIKRKDIRLLPSLAGAGSAAIGVGKAKDEVRATIPGSGGSTTNSIAGEATIKVQIAKLAIVTRVEGLDDLMEILAAEFEGVPTAGPGNGVLSLPDMVIEALYLLLLPYTGYVRVAKTQGQQSVEAPGVAIADAKGIAELADTGDQLLPVFSVIWLQPKRASLTRSLLIIPHPIANGIPNRYGLIGVTSNG